MFDRFEILKEHQELKNYYIESYSDSVSKENLCVIYCSSHGIYPDRKSAFFKHILKEDRYEWKRNTLKTARKSIFVRDLKKQWYLDGINASINSLNQLVDFLRSETAGMRLMCIGNSAGGYLATLLGCQLRASHVFTFSGQFSLYPYLEHGQCRSLNPLLFKYKDTQIAEHFYSLLPLLKSSQVPIFYFYPLDSQSDINQLLTIRDISNVYRIPFKLNEHGKTCLPINFLDLFRMDVLELKSLSKEFSNGVNPIRFSIKVSGYRKTLVFLLERNLKLGRRMLREKFERIISWFSS